MRGSGERIKQTNKQTNKQTAVAEMTNPIIDEDARLQNIRRSSDGRTGQGYDGIGVGEREILVGVRHRRRERTPGA
jgi:hypothetical protein